MRVQQIRHAISPSAYLKIPRFQVSQKYHYVQCCSSFRSELVLLLGPVALADLLVGRRISFVRLFLYGLASLAISLAITVAVDSFFWDREELER
jgi:hypothetical protein